MNYRAFFNNPNRSWSMIYKKPPEYRSTDGYLLALEYDVKYGSYVWNLYKSTTNCVDDDVCIAHNIDAEHVNVVTEQANPRTIEIADDLR